MHIFIKRISEMIEKGYDTFTKLSCVNCNEKKNYFSTYESDYYNNLFELFIETCNYGCGTYDDKTKRFVVKRRTMFEYYYDRKCTKISNYNDKIYNPMNTKFSIYSQERTINDD